MNCGKVGQGVEHKLRHHQQRSQKFTDANVSSAEQASDGQETREQMGKSRGTLRKGAGADGQPAVLADGGRSPEAMRDAVRGRSLHRHEQVSDEGADEAVDASTRHYFADELGHAEAGVQALQNSEHGVREQAVIAVLLVVIMIVVVTVMVMMSSQPMQKTVVVGFKDVRRCGSNGRIAARTRGIPGKCAVVSGHRRRRVKHRIHGCRWRRRQPDRRRWTTTLTQ